MSKRQSSLMRRIGRILLATIGGLAILLAVALGLFRLVVGQIPEYQNEIKAWVADELGLVVDFAALDARLGYAGPELTLRAASIGGSDGFLAAEGAVITLDPLALLLRRRVEFSRLTLDGVRLNIERDSDGRFHFGDYAFGDAGDGLPEFLPQSVELVIRDARLRFADAATGRSWDFTDLELRVESIGRSLIAGIRLQPPEAMAGPVRIAVEGTLPDGANRAGLWRLSADAGGIDIGEIAGLFFPGRETGPEGRGRVAAEVEWSAGALAAWRARIDLEDFEPGGSGLGSYEQLDLMLNWSRTGPTGWELDLEDLALSHAGSGWPGGVTGRFALNRDEEGVQAVSLVASFLRLDDLAPAILAFPDTQIAEQWKLFEPAGEIRELDFSLERRGANFVYDLDAVFENLAVLQVGDNPGLEGLGGRVQASENSGTVELATGALRLDWPLLFPASIGADSLSGAVVWRERPDAVQIIGVNLNLGILGEEAHATFDLLLPTDGGPATLDLDAELAEVGLVPAKAYLPERIMPGKVVDWLERSVQGGRGHDIELEFSGPLAAFPFDDGSGIFRVRADIDDATLDYQPGWPQAESLDGQIEFLNAGFGATGTGRVMDSRAGDIEVAIPDMRTGLLMVSSRAEGTLAGVVDYLRSVSLITSHLGPGFERLDINDGSVAVGLRLDLPLNDPPRFALETSLDIFDGDVSIYGLGPGFSEISGRIAATENSVTANGVEAVFLGGPVELALVRSSRPGYRAELRLSGETTAADVAAAFALPYADRLVGQTLWQGELWLPSLDPLATSSTRVIVNSNLAGIGLRLPEPLAKAPGQPSNLSLDLQFMAGNQLLMSGNLGATRRFAFSFDVDDYSIRLRRGTLQFGGEEPRLPFGEGILVGGRLEEVELDEWLALTGGNAAATNRPPFLGAEVEISELHVFGQQLGETRLRVERGPADWLIDLDSEAVAGEVVVPRGADRSRPIVADMSRVYLSTAQGGLGGIDPRTLPGVRLSAGEFGFGNRQLGAVEAIVVPAERGLLLDSFTSRTGSYSTSLSGSWLQGPLGARTTIDARVESSDVQTALRELGLDPVVSGESAAIEAQVYFDSAPSGQWLDHLYGGASLFVEDGSLREVDPGAGRVVGLMSIAALPRRLALDFRDVFQDGFAFDEIRGDFRIVDGNAYTDNLLFSGPAAEIGVVGRTGLRDRDYRQQVVVSAEPGKVLPTVGGLLGGAGVGAALLIFTRLFKEPLKGIGQASYCLSGTWESPTVVPIDNEASTEAERCAELPDEMRTEIIDE